MRLLLTGRHVEITSALRRYVETRIKRLERYGIRLGSTQVVLGVEKYRHTAEIIVTLNGTVLQSKASTTEMYASIDQLLDKVASQIRKRKEKLVDHKARTVVVKTPGNGGATWTAATPVRTVRQPLPTLTLSEAMEQLDAEAGPMLVFKNSLCDRIQVLRRLGTGAIELIDPQPA